MHYQGHKKRGFTLTELTVVLAVMAIVATLTVTFSSLISKRRAESHARLEAMQDISVAESMVEGWIKNHVPEVSAQTLTAADDTSKTLAVEDGILKINGASVYTFERVTDITFSEQKEDENSNNHILYFCSVAYMLPGSDEEEHYTFCVYKAESEVIEGDGQ